jgi:hypothetical protein
MRWYLPTGDGLVPVSDPAVQFAAHHLGGRTMPDDLRRLLELQWHDAASGTVNRLKTAGAIFLEHDGLPALIESECKGRNNLEGITRLAYAQAMADMIRYSGFVAEDVDGSAIGYWFGPDRVPIEVAPLMYFDTTGDFSVRRGDGIAEAVLVIASHGNDRAFSDLRDYLNEHGLRITAQTIRDIQQPECSPLPQVTYRQLIQSYSADLSTTSVSDTGGSVNIMTIHRGPRIGPEID